MIVIGAVIDISPFCRSSYTQISEPQKSEILEIVGKLSCALTRNLVQRPSEVISREILFCEVCDGGQQEQKQTAEYDGQSEEEFANLWEIFNFILPKLTRTPGPRIAAMIALRRILMHSTNLNQMQLSTSTSGEFCLHSLRSSIRELRIATGYSSHATVSSFA
jgi:serine/threonine-protein kinase ATR